MKLKLKKILIAAILVLTMAGSAVSAKEAVRSGILTYLGTTEGEFQEALDDLRKALTPLISEESAKQTWEDYDLLEGFLSELVRNRRVVRFYDSLMAMQMALRSEQIDEIVLPEPVVMYLMAKAPQDYEIQFSLNMMPSTISFGFKRGNDALKKDFDEAIKAMKKDGTLMTLEEHFINGISSSDPEEVKFTEFKGAKSIKVAVTGDLPPIDYIAADGRPTGYNTAILAEIGKRLKRNIRVMSVDAGGRSAALASGRADVVFWYRNTEGIKTPKKFGKNLKNVMIDSLSDGILLSEPYYEWDTDLIVGKSK
ncbi:MAG: transporter substrate-binding domain-containing protein [Synergistaceae bacterium]|nr:transporter substrate-binding domain-containing protein [Synergistaceae bacterium]MBQ7266837.1 transporter substrate-binding domain-containing protein [Synergistaceae bacterium]